MHLLVVGLNHRSAPIELRERLAFRDEQLSSGLAKLRHDTGITEAAILSTCNRVEIYASVEELDGTTDRVRRFLSDHARIEAPVLNERLYAYTEPQSVHHLFAVASGLDSMVLGEAEILHQVKKAYELAHRCEATGKILNVFFQRALNAAKVVRTHTAIGRGGTSIGTVAVELAQKIFGRLARAKVLLVGAGEVSELTLGRLAARGARDIRIMNRSFQRAANLASRYQATPLALDQLAAQLLEADIVISSTSADASILHRAEVAASMHGRHQRPLCIVDLGVPRNVDSAVGGLENVYLFNIDDLQGLVDHHHQERERATAEARAILDEKARHFLSWWHTEGVSCVPSSLGPVAAR